MLFIELNDVRQRASLRVQALKSAALDYSLSSLVSAGIIIGTVLVTGAIPTAIGALKGPKKD